MQDGEFSNSDGNPLVKLNKADIEELGASKWKLIYAFLEDSKKKNKEYIRDRKKKRIKVSNENKSVI